MAATKCKCKMKPAEVKAREREQAQAVADCQAVCAARGLCCEKAECSVEGCAIKCKPCVDAPQR